MRERRFNNAFSRLVSRNEWIQIPGAHRLQVKIKPEESSNSNRVPLWPNSLIFLIRFANQSHHLTKNRWTNSWNNWSHSSNTRSPISSYFSCFVFSFYESKIHFILDKILNEFFLYNIYKLDSCKLFCKIVPKKQVASHIRGRILVKINGDFCDFIFSRNHTFAINIYNRLQNYFSIFFIPKKQIAFIYRSICICRWKFL